MSSSKEQNTNNSADIEEGISSHDINNDINATSEEEEEDNNDNVNTANTNTNATSGLQHIEDDDTDLSLPMGMAEVISNANEPPTKPQNDNRLQVIEQLDDDDTDLPLPMGMAEEIISNDTFDPPKRIGRIEQLDDNEGPQPPAAMLGPSLDIANNKTSADNTNNLISINDEEHSPPVPFNSAEFEDNRIARNARNQVPAVEVVDPLEESVPREIAEDIRGITNTQIIDVNTRDTNRRGWGVVAHVEDRNVTPEPPQISTQAEEVSVDHDGDMNQSNNDDAQEFVEAYAVDDDIYNATILEPTLPWWKQRRARIVFGMVCVVLAAMAIALGISFSNENVRTVVVTSMPSISAVPSYAPSTSRPTNLPTSNPSMSMMPSSSPTQCAVKISKTKRRIELPLNDPVYPITKMSKRNAAMVLREKDSFETSYVIFYILNDNGVWVRNGFEIVEYDELTAEVVYDYHIDISGKDTLVGFPQMNTDAGNATGVVYIYEQRDDSGEWMQTGQIQPEEGGQAGAKFGHRIAIEDGIAVIGSKDEMALYVFEKDTDGSWKQRNKKNIEQDMIGIFLEGDVITIVHTSELHLFTYDRESYEIIPLQQIVFDGNIDIYGDSLSALYSVGQVTILANVRSDTNRLVVTTQTSNLR